MNNTQKEQVQQAKAERKIAKYSSDYDMSIVIKCIFGIFGGTMLCQFIMEGAAVFIFKKEPGVYINANSISVYVAYLAGWASAVVTFFFVKKAQSGQEENK